MPPRRYKRVAQRPKRTAPPTDSDDSSDEQPAPPVPPQPAPAPLPFFDESRFRSLENFEWYTAHVDKQFLEEQRVPAAFEAQFDIARAFANLGWAEILRLPRVYYPDLVREFYANFMVKNREEPQIHSWVRGRAIMIDSVVLCRFLRSSTAGRRPQFVVVQRQPVCTLDSDWSREYGLNALNVASSLNPKQRWTVYTRHLDIRHRILAYLLRYNVEPTTSGKNELRLTDLYIIHMMLLNQLPANVTGVNLGDIICHAMWGVTRHGTHFVFPCLISALLRHIGVDVSGVPSVEAHDLLSDTVMSKNWGYKQERGQWVNPQRRYYSPPPAGAAPEAEPMADDVPAPADPEPAPSDPSGLESRFAAFQDEVRGRLDEMQTAIGQTNSLLTYLCHQLGFPPP